MVLKRGQVDNLVTEELIGESLTKKAFVKISVRRIIVHDLWLDFKCKNNIERNRFCVWEIATTLRLGRIFVQTTLSPWLGFIT